MYVLYNLIIRRSRNTTMTKLFLIRHAEAEGNLYRFAQGQMESFITPTGYKQIALLAERFRDEPIDALYSSDLRRTLTTAGAITKYHDLTPIRDPGLREMGLGIFEGVAFGNMRKADPQQMYYFNCDPDKWCVEGAETFRECTERIFTTVSRIARENDGKTVAVVSHGMVIRSLLAHILGVKSENISDVPHGDNTAVTLLIYEDGGFTVRYMNDVSHLPPELSPFRKQVWWRKGYNGAEPGNLSFEPLDPAAPMHEIFKTYLGDALGTAVEDFAVSPECVAGVYCGDEPAGVIAFRPEAELCRIDALCLDEKYRGSGLGIQLLGYVVLYARKHDINLLRLGFAPPDERGAAFARDKGFAPNADGVPELRLG